MSIPQDKTKLIEQHLERIIASIPSTILRISITTRVAPKLASGWHTDVSKQMSRLYAMLSLLANDLDAAMSVAAVETEAIAEVCHSIDLGIAFALQEAERLHGNGWDEPAPPETVSRGLSKQTHAQLHLGCLEIERLICETRLASLDSETTSRSRSEETECRNLVAAIESLRVEIKQVRWTHGLHNDLLPSGNLREVNVPANQKLRKQKDLNSNAPGKGNALPFPPQLRESRPLDGFKDTSNPFLRANYKVTRSPSSHTIGPSHQQSFSRTARESSREATSTSNFTFPPDSQQIKPLKDDHPSSKDLFGRQPAEREENDDETCTETSTRTQGLPSVTFAQPVPTPWGRLQLPSNDSNASWKSKSKLFSNNAGTTVNPSKKSASAHMEKPGCHSNHSSTSRVTPSTKGYNESENLDESSVNATEFFDAKEESDS